MIKIVAEIGINHNGMMSRAKDLIKHVSGGYVTHVKFQKMTAKLFVHPDKYDKAHPNPVNAFGQTYGQHKEFLDFSVKEHQELKSFAEYHGLKYAVSVCDDEALREMIPLKPTYLKIPSALNTDLRFINKVCSTFDGSVHISLGMTSKEEREKIMAYCSKFKDKEIVFYECTSDYSGNGAVYMPDRFTDLKGFSCHTPDIGFGVVAVSRGAEWLEYHTTFDRESKGTDHAISLTIPEMKILGRACAQIQKVRPRPDSVPSNELEDRKRLKQT